ncbi:MAG: T9SS type A sorting domain-containing protein [Bacteroidota bacterium]|nr:T9SS type A sorting domain-containing protein [Bacteroidota bacterium]
MRFLKILILLFILIYSFRLMAQFAPPAGQEGSTAIYVDSSVFTGWASQVIIERGFMNIDEPSLGNADYGTEADALGMADNMLVSLGDGGVAVYYFDTPLMNGQGPDFAVFENSFLDDFLELCFVEVSSDGENFVRFDAISNVPNDVQIDGFGTMDASLIRNFGGKYRQMFGTAFDLEELKNEQGLDVDQISYIRLIDVVGSIDTTYAGYDSQGNIVNDPWPTPFNSSGFDLDALGIIHSAVGVEEYHLSEKGIKILFLNDEQKLLIETHYPAIEKARVNIYGIDGKNILSVNLSSEINKFDLQFFKTGMYVVNVSAGRRSVSKKFIIQ